MSLYEVTAFSLSHNGPVRNLCLMTSGFLRYEEREVYNSTAKFGYEEARTGGFGVHFRNLHNNKYLVRGASDDWITATASEPVEDRNRRDCTVFRLSIETNTTMKWIHANTGRIVSIAAPTDSSNSYYLTVRTNNFNDVVCTPIDVERIIKLPKIVVFKGDNERYLQIQSDNFQPFSGVDRHRKEVWYETFPMSNGDVRFRSVQTGRFWNRDSNGWIKADSIETTGRDPNTVFQVARLSDSTIALINRGNNLFCQRIGGSSNRFRADIDSGVKEAELHVEEPIVSRNIEVEYRLQDARIYGEQPRSWLSQVALNYARDGDLETTLSITYTESLSYTFSVTKTVSTNFTSRTTVTAKIPKVAEVSQEIEFSSGNAEETGFEETQEKSESYEFTCRVLVPPGQKRRARVLALEAQCDVPFSYVQTDVQANGDITRTDLQDGVFKGLNGYEFHVQVYDPDEPDTPFSDEPVATRLLPDTHAREKMYMKIKSLPEIEADGFGPPGAEGQ